MYELSLSVVALAVSAAAAGAQETTRPASPLDPAWTWTAPASIEWTVALPGAHGSRLAVGTADGKLHVISARTGKPRPGSPIQARVGVRPATMEWAVRRNPPQAVFCFDRYAVCEIDYDHGVRTRWLYGEAPAPGEQFAGDPEVLNGWLAARTTKYWARATRDGVIAVNSDGRVVLLSAERGAVVWQADLGRLAAVRLHTLDGNAAVLFRAAGRTQAAFLDLARQEPKPVIHELDEPWPLFSALVESGLLVVGGAEAVVWPAQGAPRRFAVSDAAPGAGVVRVALAPGRVTQPLPSRTLLVAEGARLSAFRVDTGERVWSRAAALPDGADISAIWPGGLVTGPRAAAVFDVTSGAPRFVSARPAPFELLQAFGAGDVMCVVYRDAAHEASLELDCAGQLDWATTEPIIPPRSGVYAIQAPEGLREALLLGNCFVLVSRDAIHAYRPALFRKRSGAPWMTVQNDE
jgi:hypothetical protein